MKIKLSLILFLFFLLFLLTPTVVFAQNKAGINIGDHFNDFDKAANIVGQGGWVVVMACPGDSDKIKAMIESHPEVNVIIRGHYPGYTPDANLAKLWAASLSQIVTPNKIYFMPWNEPNQSGDDHADQTQLVDYINALKTALQPTRNRVFLLSPMMNITNPNYDSYIAGLPAGFFSQFDGIAFSLYDTCDGNCTDAHQNPLYSSQLLSTIGVGGKKIFGVESGTAGNFFYFKQPPDASSPLYRFVSRILDNQPSTIEMIGIPSYDLAGEVGHTWSLFDPSNVTDLLKAFPNGTTLPAPGTIPVSLPKCPGKSFSFYINNEAECSECGSMISACKPITTDQFGEETSKQSINLPQEARYRVGQGACLTANYSGKLTLFDFEIPFAREMNLYLLGPYADNLRARVAKENVDSFKDTGVLEKLAPKEYQDRLKLDFIGEVNSRGSNSRYFGYRINGMSLESIASTFQTIQNKQNKGENLSDSDKFFLNNTWPQVPLIGNEETEGEVLFWATGIDIGNNKIKTSVPEVYRLNKAIEILAKMLGAKNNNVLRANTGNPQVLAENTCAETSVVTPETSSKESKSGPGDMICTKPEIQEKEKNLEGTRTFINDAGQACKTYAGDCSYDPDHPYEARYVENRCCGNKGKCARSGSYDIDGFPIFQCDEFQDEIEEDKCPGGCWLPETGNLVYEKCCVQEDPEKVRQFTDTNLNSKNKVPFLNLIAENAVGKSGLFRIFVPFLQEQTSESETEQAFREVAGESTANLKVEVDQPIGVTSEKGVSGAKFTMNTVEAQLTLLFHKLGTLINVKEFIAGKLLWPYSSGGLPADEPGVLDYTIDYKNTGQTITPANKDKVIEKVLASWPDSKIRDEWENVSRQATEHGFNPVFVLALWIEESGASGVSAYDLGCLAGERNNLQSQLDCFFARPYANTPFDNFMCMYSEGKPAPCSFVTNPNFPKNLKYWYDQLTL